MKKSPIIMFSTADWDNPFWTNKQHTAKRLGDRGHKVLYIESLGLRAPTIKAQDLSRIFKRLLSFFKGARKVEKNIWVYSPIVIPLHRFRIIRFINEVILKASLSYFKFKLGLGNPIVWTYNPLVLHLMNHLKPFKKVYHSVDDLSAAPGMDKELILEKERELLVEMDAVFCTSQKIYRHCLTYSKDKTHYFSNVVDYDHFSKAKSALDMPADMKEIKKPIVGFVGAISEYKIDFNLINEVSRLRPEYQWVLIGKIGEGQPLSEFGIKDASNIHFLGPKSYNSLPSYIKFFDICTIPCPVNDYTQSMFPMKFYEYMAAEKPIVARRIDSLSDLEDNFYGYSNQSEFLRALDEALEKGIKNKEANELLVRENTWEKRLDKMLKVLKCE